MRDDAADRARVVVVRDPNATEIFQPNPRAVAGMMEKGMTSLTSQTNASQAWLSLVSTQDVIGIKVFTGPGPSFGTRPAVVEAVIQELIEAGLPPGNLIVWDRSIADLHQAGYRRLATDYGIRLESSFATGYDGAVFYENPIIGTLVYGDVEFGKTGEGVGRKSFVAKLVTREITKIISVSPLLNHNRAGVCGNLYSLVSGSVDNFMRFEQDANRLAAAVPEIYALPELGDRVVINIVDALICQYQGEQRGLLHYSAVLNELRFSTDPVALDVLSIQELDRQRQAADIKSGTSNLALFQNAALLQIGISNPNKIYVERLTAP
jgi:uncharacterized protein (DUF362 family)